MGHWTEGKLSPGASRDAWGPRALESQTAGLQHPPEAHVHDPPGHSWGQGQIKGAACLDP